MSKITLGVALAASLAATAASAATMHGSARTADNAPAMDGYVVSYDAQRSYAAADPDTVIVDGKIIGRDPDPNIRLYMMRDAYSGD